MRKAVFILILFSIAGISGYLIINIFNKKERLDKSKNTRQSIEWFQHYLSNQNITFIEDQPVCLIFFNPECEYCRHEAQALFESKDKLGNIQWFWISDADMENIKKFKSDFRFLEIPKLRMIHDISGILAETAGIFTIPQILLYDHSGKLIKEFTGETKIEAILKMVM